MDDGKLVLCASSKYEQKYYLNPAFDRLPDAIKDELKIMCVLFTEDIGGILSLEYDEDGHLQFVTVADEEDILYDEIGCALKIKQYQQTKRELLVNKFWNCSTGCLSKVSRLMMLRKAS